MALANGLLIANVMHARHRPRPHVFNYGVYYLAFALDKIQLLSCRILSLGRFNLFGFYERDHGLRDGTSVEKWIRGALAQWDIPQADGRIVLVTLPRVLGYVFNPVSFWFCLDRQERLRAVLSEVSNTFGEHHSYISFHDDRRPIVHDDWLTARKVFHVSPFMDVKGYYQFRFVYSETKVGVWIDHYDEEGLMLSTAVTGKRTTLNASSLLWSFFRYPLVTLKIVGLIHYEALRLCMKGIKYRPKPSAPTTKISR